MVWKRRTWIQAPPRCAQTSLTYCETCVRSHPTSRRRLAYLACFSDFNPPKKLLVLLFSIYPHTSVELSHDIILITSSGIPPLAQLAEEASHRSSRAPHSLQLDRRPSVNPSTLDTRTENTTCLGTAVVVSALPPTI